MPPKNGFAVGQQKSRQRPAALTGDRADGGLIARIDVGTLVAIDFHGHKILVDNLGDFGVLVTLAVDDVAPVAPHRADIEQEWACLPTSARAKTSSPHSCQSMG